MERVDFFIVGTQKGGTNALDRMLREHPQVQMAATKMAAIKEVHFFDDEKRIDWMRPNYARLHEHFDWSSDGMRGEATPIYCYWPNSLERLRAYNPGAKLIMGLRHPSFRAYSHWRMVTRRRRDPLRFHEAIRAGRDRVGAAHRVFSYVERGFYSRQIRRILSLFPRSQISFFRTDALWIDPTATLSRIYAFLGVSDRPSRRREYVGTFDGSAMTEADRNYLDSLFADDIKDTASLTGLPLWDWLVPSYHEPMAPILPTAYGATSAIGTKRTSEPR